MNALDCRLTLLLGPALSQNSLTLLAAISSGVSAPFWYVADSLTGLRLPCLSRPVNFFILRMFSFVYMLFMSVVRTLRGVERRRGNDDVVQKLMLCASEVKTVLKYAA